MSEEILHSVLVPKPQPLWLPLLGAFGLHGCAGGTFVLFSLLQSCGPAKAPIDPRRSIEVSFMEVKHADRMPTKATVAPRPAGEPVPTPSPVPPAPTPVRESDLVKIDPKAVPKPGVDTAREDLLRKTKIEELLQEAMAGTTDREATDPNASGTESRSGSSTGPSADPELIRYKERVEKLFRDNFTPNQAIVSANPSLVATYDVYFDHDTGKVTRFKARKPSGNASYDASVEYAIQAVPAVPLPPERFRDMVPFFTIEFPPP